MKLSKLFLFLVGLPLLLAKSVSAHCPLCTMGAAAAAGGALYFGVNSLVIGIFIGAFAVSTGWWVSRMLKKEYFKYQKWTIIILSFVLTLLPMLPFFTQISTFSIWWFGEYGSLFNRTYLLNDFLIGSFIGGIIVCSTPWVSAKITTVRQGKMIPFQGLILTLGLLISLGIILQLVL